MGCDIHPAIQVRSRHMDAWKTVGVPDDNRWYAFFEMVGGVRAYREFGGVLASRGLPKDMGRDRDYQDERADSFGDHSYTHFTLAEMKAARPKAEEFARGCTLPDEPAALMARYDAWITLAAELGRHHEAENDDAVRFVLGFDN